MARLPRSGIRRVFDEASKYPDCIRLEVGEPSFPTPEHVKAAAREALSSNFTRYTPNAGILDLREAIGRPSASARLSLNRGRKALCRGSP